MSSAPPGRSTWHKSLGVERDIERDLFSGLADEDEPLAADQPPTFSDPDREGLARDLP